VDRRRFLWQAAGLGLTAAGTSFGFQNREAAPGEAAPARAAEEVAEPPRRDAPPYRGPNVILVRFGGGVRRLETILDPERTYCPFIYHELFRNQGILFNNAEIDSAPGIVTSHGQGTLYLLTGKYDHYEDITGRPLADRFEPPVPTIFEYLRQAFDVPEHQALIVNGEDRINEEFYTFSNHHLYGVRYRSTVLSLYRFKTFLLREELANPRLPDRERAAKQEQLRAMETRDYRTRDRHVASRELDAFWRSWQGYYGRTGLVNPRGDRVLTALALRALRELRPRLMMINYQDPDYVHWGNRHFYTRAIAIIDEGVREIYNTVRADAEYRDNTIFLIVPDCGRDSNRCMSVPFQHHFNTRSAHQIFAVAAGPGIARPRDRSGRPLVVDRPAQQCSVAATVGRLMGFATPHVDQGAGVLQEMLA
jgi:hypothetical protein